HPLGMAAREAFVMRGLLDRLQFLDAWARGQVGLGGARLESGRGPAHDFELRAHTNVSAFADSWISPLSAILRTIARISFCAASTSARRTGPRASMSSTRISAARCDMLEVILS